MKKKQYLFILIYITLTFTLLPIRTVLSMSIFDSMKVNLFSEMKGIVTFQGKPVTGALITRTAVPDDGKEYIDQTETDSNGHFHFNKMEKHMLSKILPSQATVFQKIIIEYNDEKYLAWDAITDDTDKGELNEIDIIGTDKEIDINLSCELTAEETKKAGAYITVITGICSWDKQKIID